MTVYLIDLFINSIAINNGYTCNIAAFMYELHLLVTTTVNVL